MLELPKHIQFIIKNSALKHYEPTLAKDAPTGCCVYLDWFGSAYIPEGSVYIGKHAVKRARVSRRFKEKANAVVTSLKPSKQKKGKLSAPFKRENIDTLKPLVMEAIPNYKALSKTVVRDRVISLMRRNTVVFMVPKEEVSDLEKIVLEQIVTMQSFGLLHCSVRNKRMEFNGKNLFYSDMKADIKDGINWFGLTDHDVDKMDSESKEAFYLANLSPEEQKRHIETRKRESTKEFFELLRVQQSTNMEPYKRGSISWLLGGIELTKKLDEPLDYLDKIYIKTALLSDDPIEYLDFIHLLTVVPPKFAQKVRYLGSVSYRIELLVEYIEDMPLHELHRNHLLLLSKGRLSWLSLLGDCELKEELLLKRAV